MSLLNPDGTATAIGKSGIAVKSFEDGSLGLVDTGTKQAMHLSPDQALQLRDFVRMFDQRAAPKTVLTEAHDAIHGERRDSYGTIEEGLDRYRAMWSAIFGIEVTRAQVCLAMISMKVAREAHRHQHDNLVDICGYAAMIAKVMDS